MEQENAKVERQNVDIILDARNQEHENRHGHTDTCLSSEHLPEYLKMMDYEDIEQCKSRKSQLLASLSSSQSFHGDADRGLRITVVEASRDCEYALLEVRYNRFEFYVWLLNVDEESPSHRIQKSHCGNFSTVYHAKHGGKDVAIKCTAFRNKTFQKVFRDTLLEYLVFQMADRLKCGPAMPRLFAFDLLVFRNCIEFSMEFCSHRLQPGPALAADLTAALRSLHGINVIHFDIKPENICFSEEAGKAVFIDFGLHAVVREEVGQISMTKFNGSLLMCSEEMKKIFMEGTGVADLYYNDAVCLMESLKEIGSQHISIQFQDTAEKQFHQTQLHLLVKTKYQLLKLNSLFNISKSYDRSKLFNMIQKIGNSSFQLLLDFVQNLKYSTSLEEIISEIQKLFPEINAQYLIAARFRKKLEINPKDEEEKESQYAMRLKMIRKLNSLNIAEDQSQQILKEHITLLMDQGAAGKLPQKVYFRLFAQVQQINCWKASNDTKNSLTTIFNKIKLHEETFEALTFQQKQGKCFHYILQFAARQAYVDKSLFLIIKYSLLSAILLQIYSTDQLKFHLKTITTIPCPATTKLRLFILLLSCIQWLLQCLSIYNYYFFKDLIYSLLLGFLSSITEQQRSNIREIINSLDIFLSQQYNNSRRLRQKLENLNKMLCNKLYKYYTAIKQQEQLLAEVYVYSLHTIMHIPENMLNPSIDILNKLLDLQSYRKQSQICIYDYYEHSISLIIMHDKSYFSIFKEMEINIFLGRKFVYNYLFSPEMHNGQLFFLKGDTLYFHHKDLSKLNKQQALLYRVDIFKRINQLVIKAQRLKLVFDMPSLADALSLSEVENFLPQLIQKASYKSYHKHYQIPKHFGYMYNNILCYSQLHHSGLQDILSLDIFYRLFDQLIKFLDTISCTNCKFRCLEIYFMNKGPHHKRINIQQLQQYLLRFVLWRMKQQQQFYKKETAQMIGDLCYLSNNKQAYEILLAYYVVHNNINSTFFYDFTIQFKHSYHKRLLSVLWDTRFYLEEDGQSLYFRFVFYLCRQFEHSKFRNQQYLVDFCKLFALLFEQINYQDFFSFNSQYLFQHKQKLLENQRYSVLYFSIILNNVYGQLKQIVRPFYYIFICNLFNQLKTPCKIVTRWPYYFSYVRNQVKCRSIPQRRYYFLLKMEYKNNPTQKNAELLLILQKKNHQLRKASKRKVQIRPFNKVKKKMEKYFDSLSNNF